MGRQTMQSVTVFDETGNPPLTTYPAGTDVDRIPKAHREMITNPRVFEVPFGFEQPGLDDDAVADVPESLEDCTIPHLKEIAAREGIEVGGLKLKDDFVAVLRMAGVGVSEGQ